MSCVLRWLPCIGVVTSVDVKLTIGCGLIPFGMNTSSAALYRLAVPRSRTGVCRAQLLKQALPAAEKLGGSGAKGLAAGPTDLPFIDPLTEPRRACRRRGWARARRFSTEIVGVGLIPKEGVKEEGATTDVSWTRSGGFRLTQRESAMRAARANGRREGRVAGRRPRKFAFDGPLLACTPGEPHVVSSHKHPRALRRRARAPFPSAPGSKSFSESLPRRIVHGPARRCCCCTRGNLPCANDGVGQAAWNGAGPHSFATHPLCRGAGDRRRAGRGETRVHGVGRPAGADKGLTMAMCRTPSDGL